MAGHSEGPIPDSGCALWASAARVANRWGMSRTAAVLRVNSSRLKKQLRTHATAGAGGAKAEDKTRFIDLTPFATNGSCECLLELEDGDGAKLRVRLRGTAAPDLAAITRSFRNRQP